MQNQDRKLDASLAEEIVKALDGHCEAKSDCDHCRFSANYDRKKCTIAFTLDYLEREYKPKREFSSDEKTIVRNLKDAKFLARDESNDLWSHLGKPYKDKGFWVSNGHNGCLDLSLYNHLFQSIKSTDLEPTHIDEILGKENVK